MRNVLMQQRRMRFYLEDTQERALHLEREVAKAQVGPCKVHMRSLQESA